MTAVLRICWIFFTGFPIQRWLTAAGAGLGTVGLVGAYFAPASESFPADDLRLLLLALSLIILAVLMVFPATFAAGALARGLSWPRRHALLPHFRLHMLAALALFVATVFLAFGALVIAPALALGRGVPIGSLVYVFAAISVIVLYLFVLSGDWRFNYAALPLLFGGLYAVRNSGADSVVLSPPVVGAAVLLAWGTFAVWYLHVRRVGPWTLLPTPRTRATGELVVSRASALRALLAGQLERPLGRQLLVAGVTGVGIAVLLDAISLLPSQTARPPLLTSFPWPFLVMTFAGAKAIQRVERSRALWLRVPGPRAAVRRELERTVACDWLRMLLTIMVIALLAPLLFGTSLDEVAWGLALCISATLYGSTLPLATVSGVLTYLIGFGGMMVVQMALLARAEPSPTAVTIVIAVHLASAVLFRVLAVRRWARIDWLNFRPVVVLGR